MLGHKSTADRVRNSFKGQDSEYPLHTSICINDLANLQHVLAFPEAVYLLKSGDGCWGTPLHLAVHLDSIEVANILLQAGADVIAGSSEHELRLSPLALAAREGKERLLWLFWKHLHARPFTKDIKELEMCLFQAAMNGQVPILRALLGWWEWTAKTKNDVLLWSAQSWKFYSAGLLLSELSFDQRTMDEALGCAVAFKPLLASKLIDYNGDDYLQQQLLIALLIDAGADPNGDTYGEPFIIIAARHIDLVGALKVLLEKGADPNVSNHEGKTALHFLALPTAMHQSGPPVRINETAIRLLLSHGASIHQGDTEAGATPLHAAALGSNLKVLQLYISSCSMEDKSLALRTKNRYREKLLHYAAAGAKCDIAEFLISQGIDVNGVSENGWTPLHCALTPAKQGSKMSGRVKSTSEAIRMAKLLLSHGADPLSVTAEGWTPLHCLAIFSNRKENNTEIAPFVYELVQRGVDVDARATLCDKKPWYCYWGHEVQEIIRDPGTSGATIRYGYTALHYTASYGNLSLVEALLVHGADPILKDARGNTVIQVVTHLSLMGYFLDTRKAMVDLLTDAAYPS